MIKAILFDLDGTLLNRTLSVQKFISKQYDRLNDALGHIEKDTYMERFIALDCDGYVWKDKVYQQLVDDFNIRNLAWESLFEDYLAQFRYSCIPFPNLIQTLDILKKDSILLGVITNGKGQFQMNNMRAIGIEKYFDMIMISEWGGLKKPDVRIFEKALKKLNVSANESLFVGDHPEKDVKAAQKAGIKGVGKQNEKWNNVEADYIINELSDLLLIDYGDSPPPL